MDNRHDVVIIGGGFAGLTAALHLAERGFKPLALQAAKRVFSLCRSEMFIVWGMICASDFR